MFTSFPKKEIQKLVSPVFFATCACFLGPLPYYPYSYVPPFNFFDPQNSGISNFQIANLDFLALNQKLHVALESKVLKLGG